MRTFRWHINRDRSLPIGVVKTPKVLAYVIKLNHSKDASRTIPKHKRLDCARPAVYDCREGPDSRLTSDPSN